jgi:hypothetical protein
MRTEENKQKTIKKMGEGVKNKYEALTDLGSALKSY